ncbi:MAG: glycosyltransferase family 2 protein, partial [Gemmatimonadales bacterium]
MPEGSCLMGDLIPRPTVSIGVPVFNGERHLEAALQALVGQTFADIEIIICDNASTDGTQSIATRFAAEDSRVRYIRHPKNLGAAANFRHCLSLARGRYFRWAAADDVSDPTYIERCFEVLEADSRVVLAYPKTKFIDDAGEVFELYEDRMHLTQSRPSDRFKALLENLRRCNVIFGLARTEDVRACRPFGAYQGSDYIFLGDLALRGRFFEVPELLFSRRFHEDAASAMSPEVRIRHFLPNYQGGPSLRRWRLMGGHLRSAVCATIPLSERARIAAIVLRRGVRSRDQLAEELTQ